jgi:hypothetical protein
MVRCTMKVIIYTCYYTWTLKFFMDFNPPSRPINNLISLYSKRKALGYCLRGLELLIQNRQFRMLRTFLVLRDAVTGLFDESIVNRQIGVACKMRNARLVYSIISF